MDATALLDQGTVWLCGRLTLLHTASEGLAPRSGLTQDKTINFIRKPRICNIETSSNKTSQENVSFFGSPNYLRFQFLRKFGKLAFSRLHSEAILESFSEILLLLLLPKADCRKVLSLSWFLFTFILQNFPSCSLKLVLGYHIMLILSSKLLHLLTFPITALIRWIAKLLFFKQSDFLTLNNLSVESGNKRNNLKP